ncbi:MAG: Zn-dependent hydrolase [Oceanospirillales bacterium LUC14_002_19_P2]|nr:MAG: Zn-dependent hydrolase [Oceanospirillales bacterium LUC14_002_19_P2]
MTSSYDSGLRINGQRLWQSLMIMAEIGATTGGGCNRQALTHEDKLGRDLFKRWCEDAGCSVTVDEMGNIFARREGRHDTLPPVITGSHLDTQPTGGKFDGVYGVLAGLEVMRTLQEQDMRTDAPLEVVVWTNEEGARFSPAMIGSGVWSGVFDLDYAWQRTDKAGITLQQALESIGYKGDVPVKARPVKAALELHIEQGPILEQEQLQIGILTGIQGMYWFDLTIEGQPCHAGPTPMSQRRDPFLGLSSITQKLYELAEVHAPWARVTFGDIRAEPGARNTVPERLILAVDLRHPDRSVLDFMEKAFRQIAENECKRLGLAHSIHEEWRLPPVPFDRLCINAVRHAVEQLGYPAMEMVSGAGHDAGYLAGVAPTGMIFVPCEKGLSHNEAEHAAPEDLEAGCNVLLHAMLDLAQQ